jgi:hypothetical protein
VGWFHGRLWFEAEYLAWETKGANFPALLTTGASATPPADAGALDQADTSILFGNTRLHDDLRSGGRFTVGYWLTLEQEIGFEASLMGIDGRDVELVADSSDYPVLARPYTDGVNGDEDSLLVAYPGLLLGRTRIDADMELLGGEVLVRKALIWRTEGRVDILAGYRHGYLSDRLTIHDQSLSLDAASGLAPGSELFRDDLFSVKTYFNGGELGLSTRMWRGCWSCNLTTKGAYGGVLTRSTISGDTTLVTDPGGIPVYQHDEGGLLGLPTNSGYRKFSEDAFLGELGVTLECQVSTNSRIAVGYTFFYWDSLIRLAPLIDPNVNPTQIPPGTLAGPALPAFTLQREDFWAQGLNLSFEHQF